ncbi:MAG TPA: hypothetical protein PKX92_12415 [Edaphocola sp.]|nr:hypothetical protein [Edaphocola sp.]
MFRKVNRYYILCWFLLFFVGCINEPINTIEVKELLILDSIATLYNDGDFENSTKLAKKFTIEYPNNDKGFHLLSSSYLGQSKDSLAAFFAGKALEVNPNNYIALTNMGILYDRKSEYEKATVFYEKSLKINDTLFQTYSNYLVNRIKVGDFTNAVKMGEKALEFGNHIWDKAHLCLSYHKVGDIEKRDSLLNTLKRLKFEKLTNLEVKIYEDIE